MKKVFITLFVLVCLTTLSIAQSKSSIGIFGGINIPRLIGGNGNELSRDYTSRSGGAFGITCLWTESHSEIKSEWKQS